MGFELNTLKTDKEKEVNGVWRDYFDGSRLLVARLGNENYRAFIAREYKANRIAIERGGEKADKLALRIQTEALARHVLLDWDGIVIGGSDTKYTPEIGIEVFNKMPDFKADVENIAGEMSLYSEIVDESEIEDVTKSA
ncbi:TPA: hypothetical protein NGR52_004200 [Vibrio parahaemolyticus]|nr:hypothetical protein [Vibrio parahaemolyticus]